jgi:hypothetical protein
MQAGVASQIRCFTDEDILQVAELHNRVWKVAPQLTPEMLDRYRAYFTQVFLDYPWRDKHSGSLVYEDAEGRVIGFLGVVPRRMQVDGAVVHARIGSQFIVDPASRGLVGLKLLNTFLQGPQDLSISDEANPSGRLLWERFGGVTCPFHSMRWISVLRPCRLAVLALETKHVLPTLATRSLAAFARPLDSLAARIPKIPFRPSEPLFSGEDLHEEMLAACCSQFVSRNFLRSDYDSDTARWLVRQAVRLQGYGRLHKVLVRTTTDKVAGWYIYYLKTDGLSEVLQLYAKPQFANEVLEHLRYHAWSQGAMALSGRPQTSMMQALAAKQCFFACTGRQWVVVHSNKPEVIAALGRGDLYFSRLDGEWCLRFQ